MPAVRSTEVDGYVIEAIERSVESALPLIYLRMLTRRMSPTDADGNATAAIERKAKPASKSRFLRMPIWTPLRAIDGNATGGTERSMRHASKSRYLETDICRTPPMDPAGSAIEDFKQSKRPASHWNYPQTPTSITLETIGRATDLTASNMGSVGCVESRIAAYGADISQSKSKL